MTFVEIGKGPFWGLTFKNKGSPGGSAGTKVQFETGKTFWTGIITPEKKKKKKKQCAFNHGWIIKTAVFQVDATVTKLQHHSPRFFEASAAWIFFGGDRPIEDFVCLTNSQQKNPSENPTQTFKHVGDISSIT